MNIQQHHRDTSTLICTVGRTLESHRRAILSRYSIKNTGYSVLSALSHHEHTQTELATEIGVPRTHIGIIIKDLLEKGLIEVSSDPEIRRNRTYVLSLAGYQLQRKLQDEILLVDQQLFEGLTELDLFQVGAVLERLLKNIPYLVV